MCEKKYLITWLIVSLFLILAAACAPASSSGAERMKGYLTVQDGRLTVSMVSTSADMEEPREVLITFFDLLSEGNYAKAADLYGGAYENLIDMNPDTDSNDHAALLERACTVNGFQCLQITNVVREVQDWPDTFIFTVEFANPDGSLFVLGACCGSSEMNMLPQSSFDFKVMRVQQAGNVFLVQRLPVYVP